jgi:hypothetical protein
MMWLEQRTYRLSWPGLTRPFKHPPSVELDARLKAGHDDSL